MPFRILVGSYTNEIYTVSFDPDAAKLTLESTLTVGHHPSWLTPHPTDPSLVFTGLEKDGGKAVVVRYDAGGKGTVVGEAPSGGSDPCTLLALGTELLIGNYSSGTFAVIPLTYEPPHLQASETTILQFEGTGPNKERQEASHPHQIYSHPTRAELLIPDLGADLARRFKKDASGKRYPLHRARAHQRAQRTPLATRPGGALTYRHGLHPAASRHVVRSSASMFAAEILLPAPNASYPTPYIYVSNREDPSPGNDTIAIFSTVDSDVGPKMVAEVRSGLKHLRGMVFGGPDDKWLIAGGVYGGGVKVFERVDGGKGLREVASLELEAPTGFLWI
ncbi:hypothetical protein EVJ58_g6304 [Rhodofomes roseus]|uniref:Isomerase YbhE n=1 Tax=Rhodofomes roseus TaxID=34475 RepID=A0A4Y9Y9Q5_9APHY|nr:hypothetical protein EVJ58_g6304 [Rhodofomes roseus]